MINETPIANLGAEEHLETGSPMPFWVRFASADNARAAEVKTICAEVLGPGSPGSLPSQHALWGHKYHDGYFVIMFRHESDRMMVRLAL